MNFLLDSFHWCCTILIKDPPNFKNCILSLKNWRNIAFVTSLLFIWGMQWVMPFTVLDVLASWKGSFARRSKGVIWNAVPLCLMLLIWRERNRRAFEGLERSSTELKMFLLRTMFDWMSTINSLMFSSY